MPYNYPNYTNIWGESENQIARSLKGPIFIIGGSGFIGANLFLSLLNLRDDVYSLSMDPYNSERLQGVPNQNLIKLDITNESEVENIFYHYKPQTIFNLAAYGGDSREIDNGKIHQVNYIGVLNLIKSSIKNECQAFVQAGSSSEYGHNSNGPDEKSSLSPNSEYAISKASAGMLIYHHYKKNNFPGVNLRLYSIYGPLERNHRLIPQLVECGLTKEYPLLVDKNISRDFVYVDDCTKAFILAAFNIEKVKGTSINIASGNKTTIEEIVAVIKNLFQIENEPSFGTMPNREWDLNNWYGNPHRAQEVLGWTSRVSLNEGVNKVIKWKKENSNQFFTHKGKKKISAIFACYQDELAIPVLYKRCLDVFKKLDVDYEIIFVNDGSPMNDEKVIQEITSTDNRVIGVTHSRNFGSQAAFISGMEMASGDSVVLMDGDGQDPPELIENFYDKWQEGFDVVYGERVKRQASLVMQLCYRLFYIVFKKMADVYIPKDAGDFSLIDRRIVNELLSLRERDVFIRGLRAWVGFKQVGISYQRPERLFGKSTNNVFKNIWWAKKAIFSFSTKPLDYIQSMGILFFVLACFLFVFYLFAYIIAGHDAPRGITTIILLIIGLGALQLISVSILGDYIGKILEEAKGRKRFIRQKIIRGGRSYTGDEGINGKPN